MKNKNKVMREGICLAAIAAVALIVSASPTFAVDAPTMGSAVNYVMLGGAGVTCTESKVNGEAGSLLTVVPTTTCEVVGMMHQGDAEAVQAFSDAALAYEEIAAMPCPEDAEHNLVGDIGGMTLSPGLYCISGVGLLASQLTLDGPSDEVWIFKASTSLTPINGSVVMAGGGQSQNVYWHTGTEVSLDATKFLGTILSGTAVTFTGVGSSLDGRALAKTAVTATGASIGSN